MNSFEIAEKASSNVQEFYEKGQQLLLNVVDINQLMHFENIINEMRDRDENKLIKILQRYEINI